MAGSNRRFSLAAIVLPVLFLATSGLARASVITVNTLESGSQPAPLCTLEDAIVAANTHTMHNGCAAGDGIDQIGFSVTGTIFTDDPLVIVDSSLFIFGPNLGCSGPGPCGVTIDGEGSHRIFDIENSGSNDLFGLQGLTLSDGFAPATSTGGGAIYANGKELVIENCLLANNKSAGPTTPDFGGLGGAIFGHAGTIDIVNSTLANNTSIESSPEGSEGGAIFAIGATLKLTNTTISGNKEDFGAIVPGSGLASLKGTIIANNDDSNCIVNDPTDLGFNIEDDTSCGFNPAISKNNTDPELDPAGLKNNGGPTQTLALESGSPAIGFDTDCTDQEMPADILPIDQRFFGRINSPGSCSSGAYEFDALAPIVLVPNSERVQIARSSSPNSDQVNIAFTLTDNGTVALCGPGNNPLNGVEVELAQGTCADLTSLGLDLTLFFTIHTVNHQSYGTLSRSLVPGPGTVSARIVQLPPPDMSCTGSTLNIEVAGINTATYGLTGGNPFALIVRDVVGNTGCFDVTNAIVGSQIPTPAHSVRRGVRRQTRR